MISLLEKVDYKDLASVQTLLQHLSALLDLWLLMNIEDRYKDQVFISSFPRIFPL